MSNVTCDRSGTQGAAEGLPDSDSSVGYPLPEPFPVNTHLEKKAITAASYDVALAWSKVETCLMSRNYSKVCKTALEVMHQTPTGETSQTWVSFQYVQFVISAAATLIMTAGPKVKTIWVWTSHQGSPTGRA